MTFRPVNEIEAREAVHVLLLKRLAAKLPRGSWRVKGGVNLRLFFGSVRYSEDMDLDGDVRLRDTLRRDILRAIRDPELKARLVPLGIRDLRQEGREIHKDTETTLRIKMQIIMRGGVPLPTKLEISFRPGCADDVVVEGPADAQVVGRYLKPEEMPLIVPHYPQLPAVRQKLAALALRTQVQARDVFDIFVLTGGTWAPLDLALLRRNLSDPMLREVQNRAFAIPYEAYSGKVLEFLDETDRNTWADRWEEQQLFVAELAGLILTLPGDHPRRVRSSLTRRTQQEEQQQEDQEEQDEQDDHHGAQ